MARCSLSFAVAQREQRVYHLISNHMKKVMHQQILQMQEAGIWAGVTSHRWGRLTPSYTPTVYTAMI